MTDIQKCILKIFKEIALLCEKESIPYYAIGGTCIGVVRHQGFIPWDDDMDIAIPIEKFDDFLAVASKSLPSNLEVCTYNGSPDYKWIMAKIVDKNTTMIEKQNLRNPDRYSGCFVDVMPLSGVPDSKWKQLVFGAEIKIFAHLTWMLSHSMERERGLLHKAAWIAEQPIKVMTGAGFFLDKWMELLRRHPLKDARYTGDVWVKDVWRKMVPKEYFGTPVQMPFEDTVINCPQMWDKYLAKIFGNYMELPPQEERNETHVGFADLHKPYQYYRENPHLVFSKEII